MPIPRPDESQADFIHRCIPFVMGEGKAHDQAVAMCYGLWKQKRKGDGMTVQSGLRFDFGPRRLSKVKRTDEGYLHGDAAVAKVGVMSYILTDGSIRREFVPPETLFNADSMDSLKMKPITNAHPPERVLNSSSVKSRKVGFTGERIDKEDTFLVSSVVVTDDDAIRDAEGGRRQLSPGYRAEIEMKPGVFDGEKYDAVQTKRTYNHLALVDAARGGPELQLHLDGAGDDQHFVNESGIRVDGVELHDDTQFACECLNCGNTIRTDQHCADIRCPKCGGAMRRTTRPGPGRADAGLSYEQRQSLSDSDFALVKTVDGKKIRKFPIPDAAHVRNALARLPQSNLSQDDKAKVKAKLTTAAKKYSIEVSEDGLVLDSYIDDYNWTDAEALLFSTNSKERRMKTVTINGIDYEAAPEVVNQLDALTNERDGLKAQVDTVTAERDTLKAKIDDFEKVDHKAEIAKQVKARLELERAATPYLNEETVKKLDSMESAELMRSVILKAFPNAADQLKDASETYLVARYDSALEVLKVKKDNNNDADDQMRKQRLAGTKVDDEDKGDELDQDAARKRMTDRIRHPEKYNADGTLKK